MQTCNNEPWWCVQLNLLIRDEIFQAVGWRNTNGSAPNTKLNVLYTVQSLGWCLSKAVLSASFYSNESTNQGPNTVLPPACAQRQPLHLELHQLGSKDPWFPMLIECTMNGTPPPAHHVAWTWKPFAKLASPSACWVTLMTLALVRFAKTVLLRPLRIGHDN